MLPYPDLLPILCQDEDGIGCWEEGDDMGKMAEKLMNKLAAEER
mgnify:CR=1 FL=1